MASSKSKFTKLIGQTLVSGGMLYHYIDPADKEPYPSVETVYMPTYPPSKEPRTAAQQ